MADDCNGQPAQPTQPKHQACQTTPVEEASLSFFAAHARPTAATERTNTLGDPANGRPMIPSFCLSAQTSVSEEATLPRQV